MGQTHDLPNAVVIHRPTTLALGGVDDAASVERVAIWWRRDESMT